MARPAKLTSDVQQRIILAIGSGSYLEDAARYGGITYQTFRNWMLRGERDSRGRYFEFFVAVTRAEVDAKISALAMWRRAFTTDWRAIQAWLERRYPDEWGRKDRVEITETLRREARRLADEMGLDVDEVVADAERYLASIR